MPMAASLPLPMHHHFHAPEEEVFHAALETVRTMPGWEVVTAHPETGEIHARSRGRLFTPSMVHTLRLRRAGDGIDLAMESMTARTDPKEVDDRTRDLFNTLLADRLRRGHFGPGDPR